MNTKHTTKPKISAVDLFCGIGGLTHGLVRGGIDVSAGIDIDASCKYPYEANNPSKFIQKDIEKVSASEIYHYFAKDSHTLLAGCAPCQPFSTYSRSGRNKLYESQWPLALEFGNLALKVKPDLIAMENVPQLSDHPVFTEFLKRLDGYSVWWSIVECTAFGVPQTRKRLVLLASRLGDKALKLTPTHSTPVTVRQAISNLASIEAGHPNASDSMHISPALSDLNLQRIRASLPGGTWRDWPEEIQAACHRKSTGATYPSVYGRMEWDKPAPTMTTQCFGYGNGRFGHPRDNRAISLREAAILQTFPADYKFVAEGEKVKFNRFGRLIGNAVPVLLGEVIAKSLIEHVSIYKANPEKVATEAERVTLPSATPTQKELELSI